ncbi:MAG TPA: phosphoenolpyruvate--protein phosphotransferase [Polyangia bacterium]|jgi:phosphotransferase system enzyme I (PtsI)|nr:phosphoenolpyruvate--protein phosphotransferase [Polyangia bacterium]
MSAGDGSSAAGGHGSAGLPTLLRGVGASPGLAVGPAFIVDRRRVKTPKRHIADDEVAAEMARFDAALGSSNEQLERVKKKLSEREGEDHFHIIEAHQLILHDEHLVDPTRKRIAEEKVNAEWALRRTVEEIKTVFDAIEEDYFRERRSDIDFVGDRILRNLLGVDAGPAMPPPGAVIVAHDLSPADTAHLHRASCVAFCTDVGGKTSHSAILARAFEIPSVVGLENVTEHVGNGDYVIVDGLRGEVIIRPSQEQIDEYRVRATRHQTFVHELLKNRDLPAETTDGARVRLYANVELTEEVPSALEHGAEGIGLYRTEFLFLDRTDLPKEEEHYLHARGVLKRLHPFPGTFRTFDLGGDKVVPFAALGDEANPALGLRSIRLCLRERKLFKAQLRGLLRASVHGRMRIMFPMISGVGELREAKEVLEEAKAELVRDGTSFDPKMPVGIMVEMPSAVMVADLLAKECDFLSIGTNDLIQYSLAIDRVNEHVGYLYHPLHPAILRMVRYVVDAGHAAGVRVGMCGEMAGEPMFALILLGLGLDELSMNSTAIAVVKSVLRGTTLAAAKEMAEAALSMATAQEIEAMVQEVMGKSYPEELLKAAGEMLP